MTRRPYLPSFLSYFPRTSLCLCPLVLTTSPLWWSNQKSCSSLYPSYCWLLPWVYVKAHPLSLLIISTWHCFLYGFLAPFFLLSQRPERSCTFAALLSQFPAISQLLQHSSCPSFLCGCSLWSTFLYHNVVDACFTLLMHWTIHIPQTQIPSLPWQLESS